MGEALGARDLATLEAELGEAETADTGRERPVTGGCRRGNEHEAAGGCGLHGQHHRSNQHHPPWTVDPMFTTPGSTPGTNAPPRPAPAACAGACAGAAATARR